MASPESLTRPRWSTVFRHAAVTGFADLRQIYTWKTWIAGSLLRSLMEVAFFATIGLVLQSADATAFLLIGRAVVLGAIEMMWVIQSTAWERFAGTLPLIASAPGAAWPVFAGRSTLWFPSSLVTPIVALLVVPPLFGLWFTPEQLAAMILTATVGVIGTYGFAFTLAAVVLRAPSARNAVSNVAHTTMTLVCGAIVPLAFWPSAVQWFAGIFPMTHAFVGLRVGLDADESAELWSALLPAFGLALAVGLVWFVIGALLIEGFVREGRRAGTIDL